MVFPGVPCRGFGVYRGVTGTDPQTGRLVGPGDIVAQTHQIMKNLSAILEQAGSDLEHVIKTLVFVADIDQFALFNETYKAYFPKDPPPAAPCRLASSTVGWRSRSRRLRWLRTRRPRARPERRPLRPGWKRGGARRAALKSGPLDGLRRVRASACKGAAAIGKGPGPHGSGPLFAPCAGAGRRPPPFSKNDKYSCAVFQFRAAGIDNRR